jgi:hypothetical protein
MVMKLHAHCMPQFSPGHYWPGVFTAGEQELTKPPGTLLTASPTEANIWNISSYNHS